MTKTDKEKTKEGVLKVLERFPFYRYAAKINGISEDTLINWRKEDEDFSNRCEAKRSEGIRMYAGKASPEFMLAASEPEVFGKKDKLEVEMKQPLVVIKAYGDPPVTVANKSN